MKVTQADIDEFKAQGCEVRQEPTSTGETVHVLYRGGEVRGRMEWLPEHSSVAARAARQAAAEAASQRLDAARAARTAEADREAGS